ncbi:hypothetical protein G9F72_004130 [Clostridium estertheticum]|uniref:hypothetical protein n=1 Tax=Clostridium estertheticum TaxID=238834 RepID=UPI0013E915FC|nr:hypothetical protein [Clostridium estertheticum]MBZ9685540.1 hypothetical protein [Clostridium estertheticum]
MNVVIRGFLIILAGIGTVLTGAVQSKKQDSEVKLNASELLLKLTGIDINICTCCGKGKMLTKDKLNRQNYSPPG